MKNSDEFFLELKDSVSIMDLYTEEPCDAHFHFHEDYEIYLFQGGDVDLYIEQSFHHMLRGHLCRCYEFCFQLAQPFQPGQAFPYPLRVSFRRIRDYFKGK